MATETNAPAEVKPGKAPSLLDEVGEISPQRPRILVDREGIRARSTSPVEYMNLTGSKGYRDVTDEADQGRSLAESPGDEPSSEPADGRTADTSTDSSVGSGSTSADTGTTSTGAAGKAAKSSGASTPATTGTGSAAGSGTTGGDA